MSDLNLQTKAPYHKGKKADRMRNCIMVKCQNSDAMIALELKGPKSVHQCQDVLQNQFWEEL